MKMALSHNEFAQDWFSEFLPFDNGLDSFPQYLQEEFPDLVQTRLRDRTLSSNHLLVEFVAGGLSGLTASTLLQPFDVVRTKVVASQAKLESRYNRPLQTFTQILRDDGVGGLWRGTAPTMIRVGAGAGIYFTVLQLSLGAWDTHNHTHTQRFVAGATARVVAASVMCPVSVVKSRFEAAVAHSLAHSDTPRYTGVWHALRTIYSTEGAGALYSGLGATVIRDVPYSGLNIVFYLWMKEYVTSHDPSLSMPTVHALCGAASGGLSTFLTSPPDVVRTVLQIKTKHQVSGSVCVSASGVASQYATVPEAVSYVYNKWGLMGFFRGALPRVLKRCGTGGITWCMYEGTRSWLLDRQ